MPLLYYGHYEDDRVKLYGPRMMPIKTSLFDKFKRRGTARHDGKSWVAVFYHFRDDNHSGFSWNDPAGNENSVYIPGLLNWREALVLAREHFPEVMPPAYAFRLHNYEEPVAI